MTERDVKYQAFVENDKANNFGLIVNAQEECKFYLEHPELTHIFVKRNMTQCLNHAVKFSKFYQKYADYKSLQDFPIMTKADLRAHYDEILVKEYAEGRGVREKFTSGSTGTPFRMVHDWDKACRIIGDMKALHDMVGARSHEKMVFVMSNVTDRNIPQERMERDNVYYIECAKFDKESICNLLQYFVENEVVTMIALASFYDAFARLVSNGEIPKWEGKMIAAFSQSELLKPTTKKIISDYFGCELYSYYANEENGAFAQEDGSGFGHRLNNGGYYFEVLKMDSNEPAEDGELGRAVITDFFNKAFPIIRYENGDMVAKRTLPDGREYITQIGGRMCDALYTKDGNVVNVFNAISFVEPFMDIKQFQLIQEDYQKFTWVLNTENHTYEDYIIEQSKALFGDDSEYRFEYVKEIPKLNSGKHRMTICKIKNIK